MRWIRDASGRFPQRPWYDSVEIDSLCESMVSEFLLERYKSVKYPIATDDLAVLIERHVADLDLYADLTGEGTDVQGVTDFGIDGNTRVRIDRMLATGPEWWARNRLRTTLTHELRHVILHSPLMPQTQLTLCDHLPEAHVCRCKRDTIISADATDWMEWQAGYASGAYLMPRSAATALAERCQQGKRSVRFVVGSAWGDELVRRTMTEFEVSKTAASVRLRQLGLLRNQESSSPL